MDLIEVNHLHVFKCERETKLHGKDLNVTELTALFKARS